MIPREQRASGGGVLLCVSFFGSVCIHTVLLHNDGSGMYVCVCVLCLSVYVYAYVYVCMYASLHLCVQFANN